MEILKPELEGQSQTAVAEAAAAQTETVEEMTEAEFVRKIETDGEFATDYLAGRLKLEKPEPAAPAAAVPEAKPSVPEAKPVPQTPESEKKEVPVPTDDGKFVVEFDDGSKLVYKSRNEALKAIREKENFIRSAKVSMKELRERDAANRAEIEKLKSQIHPPVPAPAPAAAPESARPASAKPDELREKAEEVLDPFDPDYLKKLGEQQMAQKQLIDQLQKQLAEDRAERDHDRQERTKREQDQEQSRVRDRELRGRYVEANAFITRHDEFRMSRPVDVVDQEYRSFLDDLGVIAGTDGSMGANMAVMDLYLDQNVEKGKALKAEADKMGIKPPEELDKFFLLLHLLETKNGLTKRDPVSGKPVPFTIEETYRYLKAQEQSGPEPAPAPAVEHRPAPPAPLNPRAAAIAEAERRSKTVATDIPTGAGGQPLGLADMNPQQIADLLDTPREELKRNPSKARMVDAIMNSIGQGALRLDGI